MNSFSIKDGFWQYFLKESSNIDGQQFHRYQQNQHSPIIKPHTQKRQWHCVGNPAPGLYMVSVSTKWRKTYIFHFTVPLIIFLLDSLYVEVNTEGVGYYYVSFASKFLSSSCAVLVHSLALCFHKFFFFL